MAVPEDCGSYGQQGGSGFGFWDALLVGAVVAWLTGGRKSVGELEPPRGVPKDLFQRFRLVAQATEAGELDAALGILSDLERRYPREADLSLIQGMIHGHREDYRPAVDALQRAEERQARWGTRGRLVACAVANLRTQVKEIPLDVDPTHPAGFAVLFALTLWKADRRAEAVSRLEGSLRAEVVTPTARRDDVRLALAVLYGWLEHPDDARAVLARVRPESDRYPAALSLIGETECDQGRYEKAVASLQKAVTLARDEAERRLFRRRLAAALERAGRIQEALAEYRRLD